MVYTMQIHVDGGCRGNGKPWAIGAAAAARKNRKGNFTQSWTTVLPSDPTPTNQRAEIAAIIIALKAALIKYQTLNTAPYLRLTIWSDSRYAIGCMTEWVKKWMNNGWVNAAGREVANRDLIEKAVGLARDVKRVGRVKYVFIPRDENEYADKLCNACMDKQ
ncbi:ribonuclease H-like protein [Aspergillus cavernicola]|uniref:ribonuclease H n=1 Tax=Aspergillus cavernicola TaxID=176166 RepID=A0ABR4IBF3_9EURO